MESLDCQVEVPLPPLMLMEAPLPDVLLELLEVPLVELLPLELDQPVLDQLVLDQVEHQRCALDPDIEDSGLHHFCDSRELI